jgi:adenylate cyclase
VPYACDEAASNAVRAAIQMQRRMTAVNEELAAMGLSEITIGIGINTGTATVGYIGSRDRTDYTAIGDTVNLASRLQSNSTGGQILISEATARAAGSIFPMTKRPPLVVKNRLQPVELFEVKWD